jgi:hypothetical protein
MSGSERSTLEVTVTFEGQPAGHTFSLSGTQQEVAGYKEQLGLTNVPLIGRSDAATPRLSPPVTDVKPKRSAFEQQKSDEFFVKLFFGFFSLAFGAFILHGIYVFFITYWMWILPVTVLLALFVWCVVFPLLAKYWRGELW